ncbi:hypothetical protein AB3X30_19970 [Raoultella terrigena]|uniref:hypothetical protein n=1 Tax=Raoultella terrigena TaxID=577 RepID=UPI00349F9D22
MCGAGGQLFTPPVRRELPGGAEPAAHLVYDLFGIFWSYLEFLVPVVLRLNKRAGFICFFEVIITRT